MSIRVSILVGALATLSSIPSSHADESAHYCQGPTSGPVSVIHDGATCSGYQVADAKGGAPKLVDFDFKGSGRLLASSDGRTVVMLQSHLYGRVTKAAKVVEFVGPAEKKNPVVLYVYRDGKKVASHRIHDLAKRPALLSQSVSHVRWLSTLPKGLDAQSFSLTTSSHRTLSFDTTSGALLKQEDSEDWKGCAVIATGMLDLPNKKLSTAFLRKKGKRSKTPLYFDLEKGFDVSTLTNKASMTACFERRGTRLVLLRELRL